MNGPSGPLGFQELLQFVKWAGPHIDKIPTIPHQIPEAHKVCLWFQNTVLYTGIAVETVKLNFHLELYATLVSNLNSGLCLELQVFCESSFTQSLDRY